MPRASRTRFYTDHRTSSLLLAGPGALPHVASARSGSAVPVANSRANRCSVRGCERGRDASLFAKTYYERIREAFLPECRLLSFIALRVFPRFPIRRVTLFSFYHALHFFLLFFALSLKVGCRRLVRLLFSSARCVFTSFSSHVTAWGFSFFFF